VRASPKAPGAAPAELLGTYWPACMPRALKMHLQLRFSKEEVSEGLREIEGLREQVSYLKKQENDVDVQLAELKANHEAAVNEFNRQNVN